MPPIGCLAFARRHLQFDGQNFNLSKYPHLVAPAAAMDSRRGVTIIVRGPPQVFGKTLLGQISMARDICLDPARTLWYCKTSVDSQAFSDTKWAPLLDSCRLLLDRQHVEVDKRGGKTRYRFPDCPIEFLSSDVRSHRNSRSGQYIYIDESWQYDPGFIKEIIDRAGSYVADCKDRVVLMETGPTKGGETDVLFESSTKSVWSPACLHCGGNVDLGMGSKETEWGFKWIEDETTRDKTGRWNVQEAAKTVRYVCPLCIQPTTYTPDGLARMNDPARGARYVVTNSNPDPRVLGFTANAFCFSDWGSVVAKWLVANNAKRGGDLSLVEDFKRKQLCIAWDPVSMVPASCKIATGPYKLGENWEETHVFKDGSRALFMLVDVQKDHFWATIEAFAHDGRSRIVFRDKVLSQYDLPEIAKRFGVRHGKWFGYRQTGQDMIELCDSSVYLDAAYSPNSMVPRICAEFGFHCIAGENRKSFKHPDGQWRIYSDVNLVDPYIGTTVANRRRVMQWRFSADGAADRVEMLSTMRDAQDRPLMSVPVDIGEEWQNQYSAEQKVREMQADGVTWVYKWRRLKPQNHYWDLKKMSVVVASMAGLVAGGADPDEFVTGPAKV